MDNWEETFRHLDKVASPPTEEQLAALGKFFDALSKFVSILESLPQLTQEQISGLEYSVQLHSEGLLNELVEDAQERDIIARSLLNSVFGEE